MELWKSLEYWESLDCMDFFCFAEIFIIFEHPVKLSVIVFDCGDLESLETLESLKFLDL